MVTLGSSTSVSYMGVWLVGGSAGSSWIANNSPNSLVISGLTEGLSYLKFNKIESDRGKEDALFTSWHVGDGVKNFFTYGDDEGSKTISAKLTGSLASLNTQKGYIKRFKKVHNRSTADNVYLFNRFDSSANAFEPFYNNALAEKKYVPILLRTVQFVWNQQTNRKTTASLAVEEVWE